MSTIWLALIVLGPALVLILLRVNAVIVYLALCLGYVLSQFDCSNGAVNKVITSSHLNHYVGGTSDTHLILLLLPAILVTIVMLKTAHGGKYSINALAAIAVGLLAALTAVPLLPTSTAINIMSSSLWRDLLKYEEPIVSISATAILVLFIMQRSKFGSKDKHSKHHKG